MQRRKYLIIKMRVQSLCKTTPTKVWTLLYGYLFNELLKATNPIPEMVHQNVETCVDSAHHNASDR